MSDYLWSKSHASFFPISMVSEYTSAGWIIDDAIPVSDDLFDEYKNVPAGKIRSAGKDGMPCWNDAPPPSPVEQVEQSGAVKSSLQREAEDAIKPLERAKSLGIATDEEIASLAEWERYSVFLMRVDTSLAPNIEWPQKPQ